MIEININIENGNSFKYEEEFKQILENLAVYFDIKKQIILDVSIVNNKKIQKLNKEHRGKNYPTDILSFDFGDSSLYDSLPFLPIGELVISHEKVEQQAVEFNHSLKREYCYLFAHGLVHLMGYDHEEENERIKMNKIVDKIFDPLGIKREE
ncbi:16S rRNA maturation RNase YbeY [Mycoplasmopsis bovigenitalium]|uniref:rRNA maturation RNase YbeY n=1 Tax=Mycoplasmopsis bovigenitalium TaxID=2112 RepID=UPI000909A5B7|nr:rRNA maturation RNase YbeY [Mycoplasmopsis bovigenitalium]BAW18417.1 16S rRNA maturation RNase YbeY [Mycoplasmopsis bovigenitalium]